MRFDECIKLKLNSPHSVVDPDGVLRVVKYTADKHNGFQAEVITSGGHKGHGGDDDGGHSGHYESAPAAHSESNVEHSYNDDHDDDGEY